MSNKLSDRELLEAAAKEAGIEIEAYHELSEPDYEYRVKENDTEDGPWMRLWDPLTDDGDALRLAVKMKMTVAVDFDRIDVGFDADFDRHVVEFIYDKPIPTDICAATRRAIVRAAAACCLRQQSSQIIG